MRQEDARNAITNWARGIELARRRETADIFSGIWWVLQWLKLCVYLWE